MARPQAPSLTHSLFIGMTPRVSGHLIQNDQASYVRDKASRSGALESLHEKRKLSNAVASTLFIRDCCYLTFGECAVFAEGDQYCNEIYATGLHDFPVEGRLNGCATPTWRRLGIPCPSDPPSLGYTPPQPPPPPPPDPDIPTEPDPEDPPEPPVECEQVGTSVRIMSVSPKTADDPWGDFVWYSLDALVDNRAISFIYGCIRDSVFTPGQFGALMQRETTRINAAYGFNIQFTLGENQPTWWRQNCGGTNYSSHELALQAHFGSLSHPACSWYFQFSYPGHHIKLVGWRGQGPQECADRTVEGNSSVISISCSIPELVCPQGRAALLSIEAASAETAVVLSEAQAQEAESNDSCSLWVKEKFAPRSYCYSYVNSAGREGQLSPASELEIVQDGDCVTVGGWDVPSAEWDVKKVRIYRAVSDSLSDFLVKASKQDVNENGTSWMLVGEVDVSAGSFEDCRPDEELTEAAVIEFLPPPPPELKNIVYMGLANIWAGFVDNIVYFSKNNNPDAWPHWFTLEDNILAIVPSGGKLFVATDGHPYVIDGVVDCEHAGVRRVTRAIEPAPMINCSSRALIAVPGGAVYPAVDGLMFIGEDARIVNITDQFYSADDWAQLMPDTMLPVWYRGKIFVFGRYKSLTFAAAATKNQAWRWDGLTELSDIQVRQAVVTRNDRLILLEDTGVYEWEGAKTSYRPYFWRSKVFQFVSPVAFKVSQVWLDGGGTVTLRVFANRRKVFERALVRDVIVKFPSWAVGEEWYYELEGTATVGKISLANLEGGLR